MKQETIRNLATTCAVALLLAACGGGGSTSSTSDTTYTGTITGFGSIFVNGVEFETEGSRVSVDGNSATEDDLKVGMQVRIKGSANGTNGKATSISFDDDVEGLVISNSITAGQLTGSMNIMGQTVNVTDTTVFESKLATVTGPDQITAGMIVEVSGYSSGMGDIQATRLEVKAADLTTYLSEHPNGIEVKGIISNLDSVNMTFDIGAMTVDYAGATLDDFINGIEDGLYVEVKSIEGLDSTSNHLLASKVELEHDGKKGHDDDDEGEVEIKGMVTTAVVDDSFAVNGETILINDGTEFEGLEKSDLVLDVIVEVEGHYVDGVLVADEVKLEEESDNEIKGVVESVTTTGVNTGTVTLVGGTEISINNETLMKDSRDEGMMPNTKFNLMDLAQGDHVEIDYYNDNGTLTAIKLEREDP